MTLVLSIKSNLQAANYPTVRTVGTSLAYSKVKLVTGACTYNPSNRKWQILIIVYKSNSTMNRMY